MHIPTNPSDATSSEPIRERGAVLAETTILMALVALVTATVITSFGGTIKDIFDELGDKLTPPATQEID